MIELLALDGVDSLVLVCQKETEVKPRSSSTAVRDFCSRPVQVLSSSQTCKNTSDNFSVLLLTFLLSVSKIWCHRD